MSRSLALDGWRGVSILLVLAAHFSPGSGLPGGLGVTIFFFVSGLLITGQLLDEQAATGRIDLPRFFRRRVLRLLPALLAFVLLAGGLFVACGGAMRPLAWGAAFYVANYAQLATHLFDTNRHGLAHPFVILWSLSIEEQFYLVWPAALLVLTHLGGRRAAVIASLVCILACLAWRAHLAPLCAGTGNHACGPHGDDWIGKATDTRADSLAYGALAAFLVRDADRFCRLLQRRSVIAFGAGLLLATLLVRDAGFRDVWRFSVQGLALLVLIPGTLAVRHPLSPLLSRPLPVAVGRLSYGLYLWHWPALMLAHRLPAAAAVLYPALTAAFALASWFAIERPLIASRRRAGSQANLELLAPRSTRSDPTSVAALVR